MLGNLNGWHLVIVLFIVLLLFGAPKLPALARSVGQSMKIFKNEIKTPEAEKAAADEQDAKAAEIRAAEQKLNDLRAEATQANDSSTKS